MIMNSNKILAANMEAVLRLALRASQDEDAKLFPKRQYAFTAAIDENLRRFQAGEHLEIDYSSP